VTVCEDRAASEEGLRWWVARQEIMATSWSEVDCEAHASVGHLPVEALVFVLANYCEACVRCAQRGDLWSPRSGTEHLCVVPKGGARGPLRVAPSTGALLRGVLLSLAVLPPPPLPFLGHCVPWDLPLVVGL